MILRFSFLSYSPNSTPFNLRIIDRLGALRHSGYRYRPIPLSWRIFARSFQGFLVFGSLYSLSTTPLPPLPTAVRTYLLSLPYMPLSSMVATIVCGLSALMFGLIIWLPKLFYKNPLNSTISTDNGKGRFPK